MKHVVLAVAAWLTGCAPVAPPERTLPSRPTIVSLNPCTDAILAQWTGPEQLLAISHYSHDPRASSMDPVDAARYAVVGGGVEDVLALDPDVVVASSFIAPATHAALEELGFHVETFGSPRTVADSIAQVERLGQLSGHSDAADKMTRRLRSIMKAGGSGDGPSAVVWQPGGIVAGSHSLIVELLGHAGFTDAAPRMGLGQADYLSLEHVLAEPPDVLFVAGSERGQQHPALTASGIEVETLPANLIYCGGPTIVRAMARLADTRERVE